MGPKKRGLFLFLILFTVGVLVFFFITRRRTSISASLDAFDNFTRFETEGEKYVISNVTRIGFSPEKIFILDSRQKKVFVFSDSLSFLYTIGGPGQGPGDLESPVDLAIQDNQVIVLESFSKRLNIFNREGNFIKRINLKLPDEIFYSYPSAILADKSNNYLVAYSLSDHLLDVYDSNGNFMETLLKREDHVVIYRKNIGNVSAIGFTNKGTILHFSALDGRFVEIFADGMVGQQFYIQDASLQKSAQDLKQTVEKESKPGTVQTDVLSFLLFTNFCVDSEDRVYVCQMKKEKHKNQRLWVFAPNGISYSSELALPEEGKARRLYCWHDLFFFVTDEEEIWMSKRRTK